MLCSVSAFVHSKGGLDIRVSLVEDAGTCTAPIDSVNEYACDLLSSGLGHADNQLSH